MQPKSMTSDQKFTHFLVAIALALLGLPIAALGGYGVYFAFTDTSAAPGLGSTAILVFCFGICAIGLGIKLTNDARKAKTRPF